MTITSANTQQIGGHHYKSVYQHWDLVVEVGMGYFDGQISKYVCRWNKKNGLEDLRKARHFAEKYWEVLQTGLLSVGTRNTQHVQEALEKFYQANRLTENHWETEVLKILAHSHGAIEVARIMNILDGQVASTPIGAT
ncbi:MAG: DUF3310 domain-containing protein [Gammaproteobacteria bacterium]|nr:DUF3310 domain-containing protein [Gammaproteobacteria bacterium]